MAIDGAGDVLVTGRLGNVHEDGGRFTVRKLDGASGEERWRYEGLLGDAVALAVAKTGEVVAAGTGGHDGDEFPHRFVVVALDGATGVARWEHVGEVGVANALALGPTGDVVAGGYLFRPVIGNDFWVTKLDATTGAPRWQRALRGSSSEPFAGALVEALAIDPTGDVVAAGGWTNHETGFDLAVVKLEGESGVERWRHSLDGQGAFLSASDNAHDVALDSRGDVVVVGRVEEADTEAFAVTKLAGADGRLRWRRTIAGSVAGHDVGVAVAIDRTTDDVYAAGQTASPAGLDFTVLQLSHVDGTELWRRTAPGSALSIALDPAGDVVAGGYAWNEVEGRADFAVATLAGATGGEPPCASACRIETAIELLRDADVDEVDPAVAERLEWRLTRTRFGRGQLADFVRSVKKLVRMGRIERVLGRRLLALVEPLLAR